MQSRQLARAKPQIYEILQRALGQDGVLFELNNDMITGCIFLHYYFATPSYDPRIEQARHIATCLPSEAPSSSTTVHPFHSSLIPHHPQQPTHRAKWGCCHGNSGEGLNSERPAKMRLPPSPRSRGELRNVSKRKWGQFPFCDGTAHLSSPSAGAQNLTQQGFRWLAQTETNKKRGKKKKKEQNEKKGSISSEESEAIYCHLVQQ